MAQISHCSIRVGTVEEYLFQIDQAYNKLCNISQGSRCELWFRGQVNQNFTLLPGISRPPINNAALEDAYLSKFQSLAIPYIQNLPAFPLPDGSPSYWSWLVMMQHYGVPTRLLDWSRYALAALFFATNPEDPGIETRVDGAVWILNPTKLNHDFDFNQNLQPGYIPNMEEPGFCQLFGPQSQKLGNLRPAAAIAPINNPNIMAQRGTFIVYPMKKGLIPLENYEDASDYLQKIYIAWESFTLIHIQLQHYGITKLALFPNIDNVSQEIRMQVQNEGILA